MRFECLNIETMAGLIQNILTYHWFGFQRRFFVLRDKGFHGSFLIVHTTEEFTAQSLLVQYGLQTMSVIVDLLSNQRESFRLRMPESSP